VCGLKQRVIICYLRASRSVHAQETTSECLRATSVPIIASWSQHEANNTSVDVVTHEAPAKMQMQVSMFEQRDSTGVTLSDRCRARLNEAQLRGEFAADVHFLIERGHADELNLNQGESEDR
jgi:hypothetical protein